MWYVQLREGDRFSTYSGPVWTDHDIPGHAAKKFLENIRLTPSADFTVDVYKLEKPTRFAGTLNFEAEVVKQ